MFSLGEGYIQTESSDLKAIDQSCGGFDMMRRSEVEKQIEDQPSVDKEHPFFFSR
jgi:hypothetical protein